MGRLRNALRAYAIDGGPPAEVVARVHRLSDAFDDVPFATLLHLLLDATSGEGRTPPPATSTAGGAARRPGGVRVAAARASAGGSGPDGWPEERLVLGPGSTLVLYTDGLVEEPGRPLGDGLAELARSAGREAEGVEALTDRILADLAQGRSRPDDIALLTLRSTGVSTAAGGRRQSA